LTAENGLSQLRFNFCCAPLLLAHHLTPFWL
jgi:hypothetical protein